MKGYIRKHEVKEFIFEFMLNLILVQGHHSADSPQREGEKVLYHGKGIERERESLMHQHKKQGSATSTTS